MKSPPQTHQDQQLIEFLDRLSRRQRKRLFAVHLRLSESNFYRRNRAFLMIAGHTVGQLATRHLGQVYRLWNEDFVMMVEVPQDQDLARISKQLQYLFAEDPMAYESGVGSDYERLCTWYSLETELGTLRDAVDAVAAANRDPKGKERAQPGGGRSGKSDASLVPLTAAEVAAIENSLRSADIGVFIKRQPVAVMVGAAPPEVIFSEYYVSINALKARLFPKIDLRNSRAVFQVLTHMLDDRMLAHLRRTRINERFSFNLNVQTILSDKFMQFDESLRTGNRGSIVIEFQKADVLMDFGAFRMARDFLRSRGYRICMDGVTPDLLPMLAHPDLDVDFLKLFWFKDQETDWRSARYGEAFKAASRRRLIMARVDDPEALALGQKLKIALFQGFHVDRAVADARNRVLPRLPRSSQSQSQGRYIPIGRPDE
ncbi:MAG: EAL domain-containing protein [Alphaproteobacteria bacterium]|nr:EAL domain-containing protein [Alphaproteobacteria bacterium]